MKQTYYTWKKKKSIKYESFQWKSHMIDKKDKISNRYNILCQNNVVFVLKYL